MSKVNRWNVTNENALWGADDGRFVKASDYDALAAVCRELAEAGTLLAADDWNYSNWIIAKDKALSLLGDDGRDGERGEG